MAAGSAPRFLLLVKQKDVDLKVAMPRQSKGTYMELTPDWKDFYSVGDYALVENIEVFEKKN